MKKNHYWLYVAVLTLITAIIWVTVTMLGKQKETTISPEVQKVMTPLDPTLDQSTLTKLQGRTK